MVNHFCEVGRGRDDRQYILMTSKHLNKAQTPTLFSASHLCRADTSALRERGHECIMRHSRASVCLRTAIAQRPAKTKKSTRRNDSYLHQRKQSGTRSTRAVSDQGNGYLSSVIKTKNMRLGIIRPRYLCLKRHLSVDECSVRRRP